MIRIRSSSSSRRGAALLIVLSVLILTVTSTSIILMQAADARQHRMMAQMERHAQQLLAAADGPIQAWLVRDSAKVMLPDDVAMPAIAILNDELHYPIHGVDQERPETIEAQITITAFDQCGMMPMQLARSASPLRLALPQDVLQLLDAIELPAAAEGAQLGLDLLSNDRMDGLSVFPECSALTLTRFGTPTEWPEPTPLMRDEGNDAHTTPLGMHVGMRVGGPGAAGAAGAAGGLIATHNADPVRINICTAPRRLLEASLRFAGQGGIEQILEARRQGLRSMLPQLAPGNVSARSAAIETIIPQLTTTSDRWAFRIDLRVGALRRSWWAVYVMAPQGRGSTRPWSCVQRLAIDQ